LAAIQQNIDRSRYNDLAEDDGAGAGAGTRRTAGAAIVPAALYCFIRLLIPSIFAAGSALACTSLYSIRSTSFSERRILTRSEALLAVLCARLRLQAAD
jgi:hypothetical protein